MAGALPHIFLTGHPSAGKTTIIKKLVQKSLHNDAECKGLITKGFYTEECRSKGGDRIGFDICYWDANEPEPKRQSLSRIVDRLKKSDPHVGKYLVDIDNVDKYAIASIRTNMGESKDSSSSKKFIDESKNELLIIDEIGKMEMLSTKFLPAVTTLLNETKRPTNFKRLVIGTIPTPRYGRVIQAVEEIRARDDVIVVHVTKANRDELCQDLQKMAKHIFLNHSQHKNYVQEVLDPYLYTRPIGASSMSGNAKQATPKSESKNSASVPILEEATSICKACGPLTMSNIKPKILILGQTASPLPSDEAHSYCERSMWIILGRMVGIEYKPIKNIETATDNEIKTYLKLKNSILSKGICIWDVFADVHEKSNGRKKRQKKSKENLPNDIDMFLKSNPSIQTIGFIGQKARSKFKCSQQTSNVDLITLPSSSPANTKLTIDDKVTFWKNVILEIIPEI
jgi:nucleoside-triphosphatase